MENPLNIQAFTATPSSVEVGSVVTPTLNWTLSLNPVGQQLDNAIGQVVPVTARTKAAVAAITASTTYTLTVTNGFADKNASVTVAFMQRFFAGAYAGNDLHTKSSAQIRAALLGGSALAGNATRTFNVDAGSGSPQFVYFAIPSGFSLSSFTAFGFDELANLVEHDVTIDDTAATPNALSYKLYRLPNAVTGVIPCVAHA